jgi:phospholipid/cholesterol/gamma-HCH transport system substrate-binding protein
MKKPSFARDFSVGFVLFVATVLVIAGLFTVGGGRSFFGKTVKYEVLLPSASGLYTGSLVFLNGLRVGSVSHIRFNEDLSSTDVIVTLSVDRDAKERVRQNSYVWLESQGLLGDMAIHIQSGTAEAPGLPPGSRIESRPRSLLEGIAGGEFAQSTEDLLATTISILKEIQEGKGTLGQLLKNPDLYENLNKFTESIANTTKELEGLTADFRGIVTDIKSGRGMLGKLVFSQEFAESIEKALTNASGLLENIREVSDRVVAGKGSIGRLVADSGLHDSGVKALDSLGRAAERLDSIVARAEEEGSVLGRLALDADMGRDKKGLISKLEKSAASLEEILRAVESGEGSLGMLVRDPSIAASVRDIFLGVKEMGLVQGVVRSAERTGREAYLRDVSFAAREEAEIRRARALARLREEKASTPPDGVRSPEGKPVPASSPANGEERKPEDPRDGSSR